MIETFIYNGEVRSIGNLPSIVDNRSFRYGDGLFETMRFSNGQLHFVEYHLERLKKGADLLGMKFPAELHNIEGLHKKLLDLHEENEGAKRVRLTLFRDSDGLYRPETDQTSYLIESTALDSNDYELNRKGLLLDVSGSFRKDKGVLSMVKSTSALLYVMASREARERQVDDLLLTNNKGDIIEATSSNLFIVRGNELFTPTLDGYAIEGVMRSVILENARSWGLKAEDTRIGLNDLFTADEVILSNSISGVRWVVGFREKRYYNRTARRIIEALNAMFSS